jgi:hypothetical protein
MNETEGLLNYTESTISSFKDQKPNNLSAVKARMGDVTRPYYQNL